jgi:hypothetical protein
LNGEEITKAQSPAAVWQPFVVSVCFVVNSLTMVRRDRLFFVLSRVTRDAHRAFVVPYVIR